MRTLNLGILAHVDAGKTTLTERLLFTAGAIDHVGSVDAGTTQTDSLDLERERGITIRSAVASFLVGDLAVNLVDTPGHPDFIAEVERVLGVLDGAVLVVSAVEGVQPQTPLLFRALQRLHVPTLIFVNKIDRAGADPGPRRRRDGTAACRRASSRWDRPTRPREPRRRRPRIAHGADGGPRRARRGDPARVRRRRGGAHARPAARAPRRADPARLGPPVFFGSAARGQSGSTSSCAGIDELLSGAPRRPGRAACRVACSRSSGPRRASASPTCACSPARCGRASACASAAARRRRRRRSRSSRPPARRAATRSLAGEMATVRGPRRGPGRRRDRRAAARRGGDRPLPAPGAGGRRVPAATRTQQGSLRAALVPARRAGPADRRPPGRPPPRDRRVALRRGPEGGHPGDARARLRDRRRLPRDDDRVHRAAGPRRRGRGGHPREDAHEHHRTELAAEHEPVQGDARAADRAGAARLRGRVPARRRAPARAALHVQARRSCSSPRWRRTSARRCAEGLAGWQVTDCRRDDDRLRLRLAR